MQELDDNALLREYVEHDSEEAFATLVTRHLSKVYSIALRHTRNPHQAEEITQAVFVILAKKSRLLPKTVILAGWLCRTAQLTAVTFLRSEIRRARREQEAYMQTLSNETESDVWPQIAPLLDAAMARLNEADHHAIVLRFFEGKNMEEIGAALGASGGTARKRVNRAVEKLHRFFIKHGVVVPIAVLTAAISANSVQAAPVVLAGTTTAVALTHGTTASPATLALVKGTLKFMAWTKAKTTIAIGTAALLLAGAATGIGTLKTAATNDTSSSQASAHSIPGVTADRTTPKGTLLVIASAMETGDAKQYIDSFIFKTSDELRLKQTSVPFIAAMARFNQALRGKFGVDATHAVFADMPFVIPTNVVAALEEKIQDDSATVSVAAGGKGFRPIQFTRVQGEWKMAADGFIHLSPAVMRDLYARVIRAMDQTTPEIMHNKFKTAREAVDQMKERAR